MLKDARVVVETGLGPNADSTPIWLKALSLMPDPEKRTLYTLEQRPIHTEVDRIQSIPRKCKWELVVCDSRYESGEKMKAVLKEGHIDVLYLDAGHDESEVQAELEQLEQFIDHKTVLLTHDATIFLPKGIPQQMDRQDTYPDGYVGVSPTYTAFRKWVDGHPGWTCVLLTYPLGMALAFYCER